MKVISRLLLPALFLWLGNEQAALAQDVAPTPKPLTLELWPNTVPGKISDTEEFELPSRGDGVRRITGIRKPSITVWRLRETGKPSPAVMICPGGGYKILAINKEGTDVAEWLNSIGVTPVLLKYRVPENREGAFQDAQRALGLLRHHAKSWYIDPHRIGIIGFSAGGHLAARLSTGYAKRTYTAVDQADNLSCRPDFALLVYPAYLADKERRLAAELTVSTQTPRTFIVHTEDDRNYVTGSIAFNAALKQAKVPAEFHLFPTGGHGYGLRPSQSPASTWPALAEAWLRTTGVIARETTQAQ